MADDFGIDLNLKNLANRSSVTRVGESKHPIEGQKSLKNIGDPLPPKADLADYPESTRQLFSYAGLLSMLKRKLNALSGENYTLVPAQGDRVCIDDDGQVHVGVAFLEENQHNEAVIAGVLAHEWGHFPTRRKIPKNLDHLSWDEIYRLRREEETKADMFCGRALFLLNQPYQPLLQYLRTHEDPQKKSPKYHTVASREQIIAASYHSQAKRNDMAGNLKMPDAVYGDPIHGSRLIGS